MGPGGGFASRVAPPPRASPSRSVASITKAPVLRALRTPRSALPATDPLQSPNTTLTSADRKGCRAGMWWLARKRSCWAAPCDPNPASRPEENDSNFRGKPDIIGWLRFRTTGLPGRLSLMGRQPIPEVFAGGDAEEPRSSLCKKTCNSLLGTLLLCRTRLDFCRLHQFGLLDHEINERAHTRR